jgi:hypothetical protein
MEDKLPFIIESFPYIAIIVGLTVGGWVFTTASDQERLSVGIELGPADPSAHRQGSDRADQAVDQ